eukprot:133605-Hanusia_phi.AAC.1
MEGREGENGMEVWDEGSKWWEEMHTHLSITISNKSSQCNLFLLIMLPRFTQLLPEYQAPVSVASNARD